MAYTWSVTAKYEPPLARCLSQCAEVFWCPPFRAPADRYKKSPQCGATHITGRHSIFTGILTGRECLLYTVPVKNAGTGRAISLAFL